MLFSNKSFLPAIAGSVISRIQRVNITIGTGATSNTATITSVNTSNSKIVWGGFSVSGDVTPNKCSPRIELTNGTTVTAYRNTSDATHTVIVSATIIEYISGVISAVQRGTAALTSTNTSGTTAVTSSSTSLSELLCLGQTTDYSTNNNFDSVAARFQQNSATQIQLDRAGSSNGITAGYELITYSSTYMLYSKNIQKNVGVNRNYDIHTLSDNNYEDDAYSLSWAGQRLSTSESNYQNDICGIEALGSKGIILGRDLYSGNATSNISFNLLVWRLGIQKRKFVSGVSAIANAASTQAVALPAGRLTGSRSFAAYLGQRVSSYTKNSASPADVWARVPYDGTDTVTLTRSGTSGANKVSIGVFEYN